MYCTNCGKPAYDKYCSHCGKRVLSTAEQNLKEYRRVERAFTKGQEVIDINLRIAAWRQAELDELGPVRKMLDIRVCPPGLEKPVLVRARVILLRLTDALRDPIDS